MKFKVFCAALCVGASVSASVPDMSGPELWIYRPYITSPDTNEENKRGDVVLSKAPLTKAQGVVEKFSSQGLSWSEDALRIEKITGSIFIAHLTGKTVVLKREIPIFDFEKLTIHVDSKQPVVLSFPDEILLKAEGGRFHFSDEGLKAHLSSQVKSILSDAQFDNYFNLKLEGNLPQVARQEAERFMKQARPQFLEQGRKALDKTLGAAELEKFLLGSIQLPQELGADGEWVLKKYNTRGATGEKAILWRLVKAELKNSPVVYVPPVAAQGDRNLLTVLLPNTSAEKIFLSALQEQNKGKDIVLNAQQSNALASAMGMEPAESLVLLTSGDRGPRSRTWYLNAADGTRRSFLDVLVTVSNGETNRALGLVFEFGQSGKAQLVNMVALGNQPKSIEVRPEWSFLQTDIAAVFGSNGLDPRGIRALGEGDKRNPEQDYSSRWSQALCIDYALTTK